MPPLRRSTRLKRTKAKAAAAMSGVESFCTREKQRREICPTPHSRSLSPTDRNLASAVAGISSEDSKLQLDATQLLNLLSIEDSPLIDEVVQSGAVPRLVEFLMMHDYPQLQCEAARVLKNIATENTKVVINSGAVPVFVKLLESSELETCEQVAWSLGNIACESFTCRDVVLNGGALPPLLTLFEKHNNLSFLRIGTWTLANMFEGGPQIPSEQLAFAMRILASLLLTKDEAVLKEACWALLNLSRCEGGIETAMYEADIYLKLADLFEHAPLSVLFPAMQAIHSILKGAENHDMRTLGVKDKLLEYIYYRPDLDAYFKEDKRCYARYLNERRKIIICADSRVDLDIVQASRWKRQSKMT